MGKVRKNRAKVVSFDVFDTLIKRLVSPAELYSCMERRLHTQGYSHWKGFAERRMQAERVAGSKNAYYTLEEIYRSAPFNEADDAELLIQMEKEFEYDNIVANAHAKAIYDAIPENTPLIAISDMYLDAETIHRMLQKAGYDRIEQIFVSCEYQASKRDGSLYRIVCDKLDIRTNELYHTGDAWRSDFLNARLHGVHASHFERSSVLKPSGDYYYDLGFGIFGGVLYEFCRWIHGKQIQGRPLYFLAREGDFLARCYQALYPQAKDIDILYASRDAITRGIAYTVLSQQPFRSLLKIMSIRRNETAEDLTIRLGISSEQMLQILQSEGIAGDAWVDERIILFFDNHRELYMDALRSYADLFDDYIDQVIQGDATLVDVGWVGSMQNLLARYFKLRGKAYQLNGLYLGVKNTNEKQGFLFDSYDETCHEVLNFSGLIEILFMPGYGSTVGYRRAEDGVHPMRGECEFSKESLEKIAAFQEGVLDFLKASARIDAEYSTQEQAKKMIRMGCKPAGSDIAQLQDLEFFENGSTHRLLESVSLFDGKRFLHDFIDCNWKTAFLKKNIHLPVGESKAVIAMRKAADRRKK